MSHYKIVAQIPKESPSASPKKSDTLESTALYAYLQGVEVSPGLKPAIETLLRMVTILRNTSCFEQIRVVLEAKDAATAQKEFKRIFKGVEFLRASLLDSMEQGDFKDISPKTSPQLLRRLVSGSVLEDTALPKGMEALASSKGALKDVRYDATRFSQAKEAVVVSVFRDFFSLSPKDCLLMIDALQVLKLITADEGLVFIQFHGKKMDLEKCMNETNSIVREEKSGFSFRKSVAKTRDASASSGDQVEAMRQQMSQSFLGWEHPQTEAFFDALIAMVDVLIDVAPVKDKNILLGIFRLATSSTIRGLQDRSKVEGFLLRQNLDEIIAQLKTKEAAEFAGTSLKYFMTEYLILHPDQKEIFLEQVHEINQGLRQKFELEEFPILNKFLNVLKKQIQKSYTCIGVTQLERLSIIVGLGNVFNENPSTEAPGEKGGTDVTVILQKAQDGKEKQDQRNTQISAALLKVQTPVTE